MASIAEQITEIQDKIDFAQNSPDEFIQSKIQEFEGLRDSVPQLISSLPDRKTLYQFYCDVLTELDNNPEGFTQRELAMLSSNKSDLESYINFLDIQPF